MSTSRAHVTCPMCHERFIDTDMSEWIDQGRSPEEFLDAMERLTRAHADTCKPHPPPLSRAMIRGRLVSRIGTWVPAGMFIGWAVMRLIAGDWDGLIGISAGLCLLFAGVSERRSYVAGYRRGHFASTYNQPFLAARWLHPGDGVNDPADQRPPHQPGES